MEIHHLPDPADLRYEVKFAADITDMPVILGWVQTHRCGFKQCHPDRYINNVYLDTPDLMAYEDNASGISDREKVRFRWYGEHWKPASGTLEVKCRSDSVGWKWNSRVVAPLDLTTMTWQQIRDLMRPSIKPELRFLFDTQSIVALVNRYSRKYFVSRDDKIRLTIDRNIQVFPQVGRTRPAIRYPGHKVDGLIIEVKCAVEHRILAADVLTTIPWRVSRHSKYVVGIESLTNI